MIRRLPTFTVGRYLTPQSELANLIRKRSGIDFGEIVSLVPLARGLPGGNCRLRIVGTKVSRVVGKELFIRRILSRFAFIQFCIYGTSGKCEGWYSAVIYLERGQVGGHGVGLCSSDRCGGDGAKGILSGKYCRIIIVTVIERIY